MLDYEVMPHAGVGPVKLGMTRTEVRSAMHETPRTFRKTPACEHETDAWHRSGFQVFYAGEPPRVEFIELSRKCGFRALYEGLSVFDEKADDLVARVSQDAALAPNEREVGYTYVFPALDLSLWRSVVPESPSDTEGQHFDTIRIGSKGYYHNWAVGSRRD